MLIRLQWGRKGRQDFKGTVCNLPHGCNGEKNKVSEIAEDRILQLLFFFIISVCNTLRAICLSEGGHQVLTVLQDLDYVQILILFF